MYVILDMFMNRIYKDKSFNTYEEGYNFVLNEVLDGDEWPLAFGNFLIMQEEEE